MNKDTIGAILRDRIEECGYSQEEFAGKAGVGLSTLKKHMTGKTAYKYTELLKYAELLNCSYDYLLGYSSAPIRENHEIAKEIKLSEKSINTLRTVSKKIDSDLMCKMMMRTFDEIVCSETFVQSLLLYCGVNRILEESINELSNALVYSLYPDIDSLNSEKTKDYIKYKIGNLYLAQLMQDIEKIKLNMKDELLDDMRNSLNRIIRYAENMK